MGVSEVAVLDERQSGRRECDRPLTAPSDDLHRGRDVADIVAWNVVQLVNSDQQPGSKVGHDFA